MFAGTLSQQVQQLLTLISARMKTATEWRARVRDALADSPVDKPTLQELEGLSTEANSLQVCEYLSC